MLRLALLASFEQLRLNGTYFCCFGDFAQINPVSNSWRGATIAPDAFEKSKLFKAWCPKVFTLTRCHRSDEDTFRFYCSLPSLPLEDAKRLARERFPAKGDCDWNIVISHSRRHRINRDRQKSFCEGKETVSIPKYSDPAFKCCVGTRLLGSNNSYKAIHNGGLYHVTALGEGIHLEDEHGVKFIVTAEQVAKHLRLSWAVTYPAIQGRTLQGTVGVWDADSKHFSCKHLYVGVSRATYGSKVSVY